VQAPSKNPDDYLLGEPAQRARPTDVGRAAAAVVVLGGVAICGWRVARLQAAIGYIDLSALLDDIADVAGLAALIAIVLSVVAISSLGLWGLLAPRRAVHARNVVIVLLLAAGSGALAAAPVERHWPDPNGDDIGWVSLIDSVRQTVDSGATDPWRRYSWSAPSTDH
jgi:hypothetical protein